MRTGGDAGHEQFPHAGLVPQAHRVAARVPGVEIADHRHAGGVGRPHREAGTAHAIDFDHVGAERVGQLQVVAFGYQVQVEIAELRAERVGVLGVLLAAGPADAQPVAAVVGQGGGEEAGAGAFLQRHFAAVVEHRGDRFGAGQVAAQHARVADAVRTEHGERIAVAGVGERTQRCLVPGVADISHCIASSGAGKRSSMRSSPCIGTMLQAGRLAAS